MIKSFIKKPVVNPRKITPQPSGSRTPAVEGSENPSWGARNSRINVPYTKAQHNIAKRTFK